MTHQRISTVRLVAAVSVLWAVGGSAPAVWAGEADCAGATGSCFEAHDTPGCNELACCIAICSLPFQDFCCQVEWDQECADAASSPMKITLCTPPEKCCRTDGTCPEGSEPGIDTDFDGICDDVDNCPTFPNPDQADADNNGVGDPCEDTDGDGVIDGLDVCPDSDQSDVEVMIGKCSTSIINQMTPSGCSFIDAINLCEAGATSHGRFVRCVALRAVIWIRSGMIERRSLGRIIRCAARANIPPR